MNQAAYPSAYDAPDGISCTAEHEIFRKTVRRFIEKEIDPFYMSWEKTEIGYPLELWKKAAAAGLVGVFVPEEYGGPGCDPLYSIVLTEETGRTVAGASLGPAIFNSDFLTILLAEFGTHSQKRQYFPDMLAGNVTQCVAMTEPDAGSDVNAMRTRARRDGDDFLISGQKIFISNGMHANLCYLVCKTDKDIEHGRGAMSMFLIDMDTPGLERRRLETLGIKSASTAELFFDEMRIPASAMLGEEGQAMRTTLDNFFIFDRVMAAIRSVEIAELAFNLTVEYVKNRKVFGRTVFDFQNTQFQLAELKAELIVAQPFKNMLVSRFCAGTLDHLTVSAAKLWITEMEYRVADTCLQLHGGHGYMAEAAIAKIFTFARLERIYGGTSEIQKGLIARFI